MNGKEFHKSIERLEARIVKLEKSNTELKKIVTEQSDELVFLRKENKRLSTELRKHSNENTPSGSIPPYLKPSTRNKIETAMKEEPQNEKPNPRNTRPTEYDIERNITLDRCPCCGGTRITKKRKSYSRTTLSIKLPFAQRVLNKIHAYYCLDCKKEVVPSLPDALPNSKFDLTTAILISVFYTGFNLSVDKISELFHTLFHLNISPGTIANTLGTLKDYLKKDYKKLEREIEKAEFVHRDDTSWRKNGKINWLSVASTANAVYFKINKRLNAKNAKKLKLNKNCIQISDAHSVYNDTAKKQQKCWAHLSRLAKKPKHYFKTRQEKKEYESHARQVMNLFHNAKKDKLELECSKELRKKYDNTLLELLGEKNKRQNRWTGGNALRLKKYILKRKKQWFTFLEYENVNPTNNRAERDLRHLVLKRKISQQNRSTKHMHSYEMQASLYKTSKTRGAEYPQVLQEILEKQLTGKI